MNPAEFECRNTANSTGALGLYEHLGFTQINKGITFRLPLT